ncbi:NADH-quinone oxidoreductase subunit NuoF [Gordonia sp. NB41Y]|uniref:NADH-quinone oxidoreductase subunit NuoF n=1 Tax=Gordonia sp. NB41Y TaxID=875808 RepID=UPI0002BE5A70|nr:NADH-quinone oxidoreductase subunit NuoF [Gordonia sp. NB41Y]WLP92668.1 NADH-quinone oxidoreductase subunit NuoF [Gordonia sp. NB41Y]
MSEPVFVELGVGPPDPVAEPPATGGPGAHPPITFSGPDSYPDDVLARLRAQAGPVIARYPQSRSALLPLLHLVQSEDGLISRAGIGFCAEVLGLSDAQVAAVATFYSMFRRTPTGEYLIGVCTNTLCGIVGGEEILRRLCDHLGVEPGGTTSDSRITVEEIECNAACDRAPVVMINWEFFDTQTPESIVEIAEDLRAGLVRAPSRGSSTLCGFRDTERILAGVDVGARPAAGPSAPDSSEATAEPEPEPAEVPVLTRHWGEPQSWTLPNYLRHNGYRGLRTALGMAPDEVIELVKASGLRGRGGAGFPVGMKWSFIPQSDDPHAPPHYLVVNADESEPGTCKDMPLMLADPHSLVEGAIIAAYAIRARHAFIYLRGEVVGVLQRLRAAVDEAYAAGYLGENILGSGVDVELLVHAGAGAYICGEETALLDSLEGRRGQPRLRPPFPAVAGLYASPTVVNNVESIASVPAILRNGIDWFRAMGTERSPGFTLYSLSGHVRNPGQYEAPLGITLRELLSRAGGVRPGHTLKFWTPGGSSTPMFTAGHLDVPLDYEGVGAAGSMLGTKALQIFDETTCVVRAVLRWTRFYAHESCGKCTPCREGTYWLVQQLRRIESGQLTEPEIVAALDVLADVTDGVVGKSFCALGDGAGSPITSSLAHFRDEYLAHARTGHGPGGCPLDPAAATVFADHGGVR